MSLPDLEGSLKSFCERIFITHCCIYMWLP
jgi:hypothetical protein